MSDKMRESFRIWAEGKGYDMACTYDTARSRHIWLSPMTADLWESWQAAQSVPIAKTADDEFEILGEIAESGGLSAAVWG